MGWLGGPTVVAAYVFGELLDGPDQLDRIDVVLAAPLRPEEVQWSVMPPTVTRFLRRTHLSRLPVRWLCMPSAWPVANDYIRHPVRIWSTDGPCPHVIQLIAQRRFADLRPEAPPTAEQLMREREAADSMW